MAPKKAAKKTPNKASAAAESGGVDISETLRSLKTKFGDEVIMTLDESKKIDIASIGTG